MQVGAFPGFRELNRRTIRGPVNPLDKSTVISIYPKKIRVVNLTLTPGVFELEPGSVEKPSLLVLGPSSWWKELDLNEPLLEIPVSSIMVADSIVKDFCNGIFGAEGGESQPGLFFIPGAQTIKSIRENPDNLLLLERAVRQQTNYYNTLIKFADALWAESSGNPLCVIDEMRLAARSLGIEDRDWMKDHVRQGMVRCSACGSMKSPDFPVCPSCRAVDMSHPTAKDLKFALS